MEPTHPHRQVENATAPSAGGSPDGDGMGRAGWESGYLFEQPLDSIPNDPKSVGLLLMSFRTDDNFSLGILCDPEEGRARRLPGSEGSRPRLAACESVHPLVAEAMRGSRPGGYHESVFRKQSFRADCGCSGSTQVLPSPGDDLPCDIWFIGNH